MLAISVEVGQTVVGRRRVLRHRGDEGSPRFQCNK